MRVEVELNVGELVPAILDLPAQAGRSPGVVLLHGLGSSKEQISESVGQSLLERGVASIAIDLPVGGRQTNGLQSLASRSPIALVDQWFVAVRQVHFAVAYLASHDAIDHSRIGMAGYSLGAYLAVMVAADNLAIRAIALAAGGDLPRETPFASVVRSFIDPKRAVRELAGRPLLMVNGRQDVHVRPELARTLYEAASEPKELHWYDGGHWPPPAVIDATAAWLSRRLVGTMSSSAAESRTARTMAPNQP